MDNKTYRYHRPEIPPPVSAEHPNAMACPNCGKPVWQSAPACHACGCELDGVAWEKRSAP